MSKVSKVVLAYSGGLDTSAIIPWLKENYDCEVIAFVADVGQGEEELVGIEEKAIASGAVKCIVADLKEEMVADYIYPSLKTGAVYEGKYLLGTSMARPIIAKARLKLRWLKVQMPFATVVPVRVMTRFVLKALMLHWLRTSP